MTLAVPGMTVQVLSIFPQMRGLAASLQSFVQMGIFAFLLHEQPFERFRFARWQSVVAITLLGICSGLDPNMAGNAPDTPHPVALPLSVVREHWLASFDDEGLGRRFFAGAVTFATLMCSGASIAH